jgi:predicted nucleic acid-binding protein
VTSFVDTNILVRHLTGDPADQAARATTLLRSDEVLLLTDVIAAEIAYVLRSVYEASPKQVAAGLRSIVTFDRVVTVDPLLLLRAIEIYEVDRLDFVDAYLVAAAESHGVDRVMSFGRTIDRMTTIERVEP